MARAEEAKAALTDAADGEASAGEGAERRLCARARGLCAVAAGRPQFDVDGGDADFFAALGNVLGGKHGRVRGGFVAVSLDLHATRDTDNRFPKSQGKQDERAAQQGWFGCQRRRATRAALQGPLVTRAPHHTTATPAYEARPSGEPRHDQQGLAQPWDHGARVPPTRVYRHKGTQRVKPVEWCRCSDHVLTCRRDL